MKLPEFAIERYFAKWEFVAPYMLSGSDMESYRMADLLALADDECLTLWQDLTLAYTESSGHPLLKREIANLYETVTPDDVLTLAGAEEGIFAVMNVLLGPGDHAVVVWPCYQSLHEVARATGADVSLVPLDEANGWTLDLDALKRALRPNTRLIVVNFPNNPTGATLDRTTFDRLVALARDRNLYLFFDEVYRLLEHNPAERLPAAVDCYERAVSLGVMSKSLGLPGLRIGWIATKDRDLLARIAAFKDYTTICNSAPSEILAIIGLRAKETILARNRQIVADNLALLASFFDRYAAMFHWTRPRAGSIAFPRLIAPIPVETFCAELVEKAGVLLLPGTVFGASPDSARSNNHFRLGFGRVHLPAALDRLERFLASP